ncbi:MAG TPA: ABC transporter substrate-binding protein [Trueperaceae bacterium]|nr:ABC transporter substrate-binding protein [Trueperaceae bacterium]
MKRMLQLALVAAALLGGMALAQQKAVIGVSIPAADHGWTAGVVYWANQAKAQVEEAYPNLSVIVKTAKDPAEQANQIQDLVTVNKIDALVILPYESAPLTKPVADVKKQGVFVVVVDRGLTDPSIQDVYVAGDNPGMGRVSGEYVAQKLGGKGQIVVLRGIPTVIDNERYNAFMDVMKQHPDIEVLDAQYANWNRDDGFKVMQDFLTRFPHIDAVWAQDDDIAVGVLRAIQQANRSDVKFVLGGAGMKEFIKKVMDGDPLVPADVLYPPNMVATAVNVAALHYSGGSAILGTYIVSAPLVTKDNASQYYYPNSPF